MEDEPNIQFPRHRKPEPDDASRFLKIRNILNIIFMIGAIIGMIVYFISDHTTGIIIILSSMVFKIAECCLRFFR